MPGPLALSKIDLFKLSDKKASVVITRLGPNDAAGESLALQYWPDTITDSRAVNWTNKAIPGGNLPIYSWVNGGDRNITFSAVFTTDIDLTKWQKDAAYAARTDEQLVQDMKRQGLTRRNIDIRSALIWLRSFTMPTYNPDGTYLPPAKLRLTIPGSRIALSVGDDGSGDDPDAIIAIMTQCEITYNAFFPNGNPRIANVQLGFAQIAQKSGIVNFPGRTDRIDSIVTSGDTGTGIAAYPFKV
jgi:hypothetical protein